MRLCKTTISFSLLALSQACTGANDYSADVKRPAPVQKKAIDSPVPSTEVKAQSIPSTAEVKASANTPVQPVAPVALPEAVAKQPFQPCLTNGVASATQPLTAKVYELRAGAQSLAQEFQNGVYKTQICMTRFDVPTRSFTDGFPGIPGLTEWFAIDARAKLLIKTAGFYTFRLNSDDGSILYIDNNKIIDNDGQHSTSSKEGSIELTATTHELKVVYFQGPATEIALQLFWTAPNKPEEIVGSENFSPSPF